MTDSLHPTYERPSTYVTGLPEGIPSYEIDDAKKTYKHQYSNIYYMRLQLLRSFVQTRAKAKWKDVTGNPPYIERVLEVNRGELCYIIGTIYMEMPLKPNVMDDIASDLAIPPPPPLTKFHSAEDAVMIEDESGRIQLVGDRLKKANIVTGVIVGALGMENSDGGFEVADLCYAGMPPQEADADVPSPSKGEDKMEIDSDSESHELVAFISGLSLDDENCNDVNMDMLAEFLGGTGCQDFLASITSSYRRQFPRTGGASSTRRGRNRYYQVLEKPGSIQFLHCAYTTTRCFHARYCQGDADSPHPGTYGSIRSDPPTTTGSTWDVW